MDAVFKFSVVSDLFQFQKAALWNIQVFKKHFSGTSSRSGREGLSTLQGRVRGIQDMRLAFFLGKR